MIAPANYSNMITRSFGSICPVLAVALLLVVPGGAGFSNDNGGASPAAASRQAFDTATNSLAAMQADLAAARQLVANSIDRDNAPIKGPSLGATAAAPRLVQAAVDPPPAAMQAAAIQAAVDVDITDPPVDRLSAMRADFAAARRRLAAKNADRERREDPDNAPNLVPSLATGNSHLTAAAAAAAASRVSSLAEAAVAVLLPASRDSLVNPLVKVSATGVRAMNTPTRPRAVALYRPLRSDPRSPPRAITLFSPNLRTWTIQCHLVASMPEINYG